MENTIGVGWCPRFPKLRYYIIDPQESLNINLLDMNNCSHYFYTVTV